MTMDFRDDAERLFAEQAVLARRAVMEAACGAARGQGLAVTEAALNEQSRALLNRMLLDALREQPGVEKKGETPSPAVAESSSDSKDSQPRR